MSDAGRDVSDDGFLGGRLRLLQPRRGHRAGHDAVLLAAATNAQAGGALVDLGAGVGAAGLAVAVRVTGLDLTLVDIDEALVALAEENARCNGLIARAVCLDVAASAELFAAAGLAPDNFDNVIMNPPFNDPSRHQPSPLAGRKRAHASDASTLDLWIHAARRLLKPGGRLTLIWRAEALGEILAALRVGFGALAILPVHAKPGARASRVLVGAVKGARAATALLEGVALNDEAGRPTAYIQSLLNGRDVLPLAKT